MPADRKIFSGAHPGRSAEHKRPKQIILGISGSIAAYKSVSLARLLTSEGYAVQTLLTRSASRFVASAALAAASRRPVLSAQAFANGPEGLLPDHVELAAWADMVGIAPLTANLLARVSLGLAEDPISELLLGFRGPVLMAPAMHSDMWWNPATQEHVERMKSRGAHFIGPEEGALSHGDYGAGRMSDPELITQTVVNALEELDGLRSSMPPKFAYETAKSTAAAAEASGENSGKQPEQEVEAQIAAAEEESSTEPATVDEFFSEIVEHASEISAQLAAAVAPGKAPKKEVPSVNARLTAFEEQQRNSGDIEQNRAAGEDSPDLLGLRMLITAGGTREHLDPARFIGNTSSGKQGVALAHAAQQRGAEVILLGANLQVAPPEQLQSYSARSTADLEQLLEEYSPWADVIIMAAAVSDFRPEIIRSDKLKKSPGEEEINLRLIHNPDLLAGLVRRRHMGQIIIGFAAETVPDLEERLEVARIKQKRKGCDYMVVNQVGMAQGFGSDDNEVFILNLSGEICVAASGDKLLIANRILDLLVLKNHSEPPREGSSTPPSISPSASGEHGGGGDL